MNVFVSAGEASGDAYAAALVGELRALSPDLEFAGIGGRRVRGAGVKIVADSSQWGAISILESAKVFFRVLGGYSRSKRFLSSTSPGLLVVVDFGFMNIRLARHAKAHGWKVLYFVPPGSWRRDRQGKDMPAIADAVSTPFPWSADLLRAIGTNVHWFGHPIKQLLRDRGVGRSPVSFERIAVLPGSRKHEISEHLPVLAASVKQPIEFALAPSLDVAAFKATWSRLAPGRSADVFTQGDVYGVLTRCSAAVVCSGTATLEAALCRCPMVVIYKFPKIAEFEAKVVGFKRPKYISLPNILLDQKVVPELVQEDATPANLTRELAAILTDATARQAQLNAFDELDALLGPADAIAQTARLALSLISQTSAV